MKYEINLSKRARTYLESLSRDRKWSSDQDLTKAYLVNQKIRPFECFLRYQTLYSGYKLTIKEDPGHSFSASLFSVDQIRKNETIEMREVGGRRVAVCGDHQTAQFVFYISDRGEICTINHEGSLNILHSSFDKMLEAYALRNEIYNWSSNPGYFSVEDLQALTHTMKSEFQLISACSDQYSTWWEKEDLIAVKGIWLDRAEPYFHVYGKERSQCDDLIEKLKTNGVLK